MKVRTFIAAVSAAALLSGTAAADLPAVASSGTTMQTLKFISVTEHSLTFSKTNLGRQDTDVNRRGKTVGFDMLNSTVDAKTGKGTILVTVDASGGFLIGYLVGGTGKTLRGLVTGGVGTFKDAFGTIVATALNKARTRTSFTITYHT